jgi:4-amino-4-deoxy-L-arabinose transferase-like glycosyltransferase
VLTKGPVAVAIPLLVAAPYALWRRRARAIWHPAGPVLLAAAVLPWALAVEARAPGFLRYALVTETWLRLTTDRMQRTGPLWYFVPFLLAGAFPWVLAPIVSGLGRLRRRLPIEPEPALVFLLLWIALPLVFFSLSQSKRPHYILPLVPAVALLAARAWSRQHPPAAAARTGAALWLLLGGVLLAVSGAPAALAARAGAAVAAAAVPFARLLGAFGVASGLVAWRFARHRTLGPIALSLPLVALPLLAGPALASVAQERSAKAVAAALRPRLTPDAVVVGVETFPPSITFYLDRPIAVASADPRVLSSNYLLSTPGGRVAAGAPALRPPGWWLPALAACERPTFVVLERPFEPRLAAARSAGLPLLLAEGALAALGPCRPPPGRSPSADGPFGRGDAAAQNDQRTPTEGSKPPQLSGVEPTDTAPSGPVWKTKSSKPRTLSRS